MQGAAPSVEFLSAFAGALGVSIEWLLTGAGAMRSKDVKPQVLREASVTELLNAMAQTIERLIMRVERLEAYMQTLETRIRANTSEADRSENALDSRDGTRGLITTIQGREPDATGPAIGPAAPGPASPRQRARSIADALPQRARPDAGGTPPSNGS